MQPLSLQELSQQITTLNSEDNPYQYNINANVITGSWKIADIKWTGIFAQGTIQKDYTITVTLDEAKHAYSFKELQTAQQSEVGADGSGGFSLSKGGSFFSGKTIGKQFGAGIGTSSTPKSDPTANTYQYSFDTGKIKKPLFDLLDQSGWLPEKNGFFSKLFSN